MLFPYRMPPPSPFCPFSHCPLSGHAHVYSPHSPIQFCLHMLITLLLTEIHIKHPPPLCPAHTKKKLGLVLLLRFSVVQTVHVTSHLLIISRGEMWKLIIHLLLLSKRKTPVVTFTKLKLLNTKLTCSAYFQKWCLSAAGLSLFLLLGMWSSPVLCGGCGWCQWSLFVGQFHSSHQASVIS